MKRGCIRALGFPLASRMVAALLLLVSGCAPARAPEHPAAALPPGSPLHDSTLAEEDGWLRHHLMFGSPAAAIEILSARDSTGPDRVLHALQEALLQREIGAFERSNELLEWAEQESEQLGVLSATESAASLLINDRQRAFVAKPGESPLLPYYRMMNHLAVSDLDGAAVEARRLSALLERDEDPVRRCSEHVVLQHLAALVFEAVGDGNSAMVSLRQAERSLASCGEEGSKLAVELAVEHRRIARRFGFEAAQGPTSSHPMIGEGELVLVVERGFVAHRAESALHVPLFRQEIERLESGDGAGIVHAAARISERVLTDLLERERWGRSWNDLSSTQLVYASRGAYILRLAWPSMESSGPLPTLNLWMGPESGRIAGVAELSRVAAHDLAEERTASLSRLVVRGVTKFLAAREIEKKAEKAGGDLLGFFAGRLANFAGNQSERPDTRSWTLLPEQVVLVRATLPVGAHEIVLESVAPDGTAHRVELGRVEIEVGATSFVNRRYWPELTSRSRE